jgi:hypothetical protein
MYARRAFEIVAGFPTLSSIVNGWRSEGKARFGHPGGAARDLLLLLRVSGKAQQIPRCARDDREEQAALTWISSFEFPDLTCAMVSFSKLE